MTDEERWQSLDETTLAMRGRTEALEMVVIELLVGWMGPNPNRVELMTELRNRMLRDLAAAEGVLRHEERAVRQTESIHTALADMFERLFVLFEDRPIPGRPEAG